MSSSREKAFYKTQGESKNKEKIHTEFKSVGAFPQGQPAEKLSPSTCEQWGENDPGQVIKHEDELQMDLPHLSLIGITNPESKEK